MNEAYPYRIIISENNDFIKFYNNDIENSLVASQCLTANEAFGLLQKNQDVEIIIIIKEGDKHIDKNLSDYFKWNRRKPPEIVSVDLPADFNVAVLFIRKIICKFSNLLLWAEIGIPPKISSETEWFTDFSIG